MELQLSDKCISIFGLVLLLILSILLVGYLYFHFTYEKLPVGEQIPLFSLSTLTGDIVSVEEHDNMLQLIVYFTTECGYCANTLKNINKLYGEYSNKIRFLGISGSEPGKTSVFINENEISFPVLLDYTQKIKKTYRVRSVPSLFFVDKNFRLKATGIGYRSYDYYREWIINNMSEDIQEN